FPCLSSDTSPPETYTLSLHDALPISVGEAGRQAGLQIGQFGALDGLALDAVGQSLAGGFLRRGETLRAFVDFQHAFGVQVAVRRSEEHTSELQSRENLVCRLLLEKKK